MPVQANRFYGHRQQRYARSRLIAEPNIDAYPEPDTSPGKITGFPADFFEPAGGEPFDFTGSIALPAADGNFHAVKAFTVPQGYNGIINKLANEYIGAGFISGSGAVIWQLMVNTAINQVQPNYDNIQASLGLVANPSKIAPIRIKENQVITFLVKNVSIVPAGQLINVRIGGYFYPVVDEPNDTGF